MVVRSRHLVDFPALEQFRPPSPAFPSIAQTSPLKPTAPSQSRAAVTAKMLNRQKTAGNNLVNKFAERIQYVNVKVLPLYCIVQYV